MEVMTKAYGKVELDERQRITLTSGLFGFEELKDFVLMDATQKPFLIFQSIQDQDVAFILIDPFFFRDEYEPRLSKVELEEIGLDSEKSEQALILAVVTVPPASSGPITANLQGPLVINRETRTGRQFIAQDIQWETRHNILEELAKKREKTC